MHGYENFQSSEIVETQQQDMIYYPHSLDIATGFCRNQLNPKLKAKNMEVIGFGAGQVHVKICDGVYGKPITYVLAAANASHPTWLQPTIQT